MMDLEAGQKPEEKITEDEEKAITGEQAPKLELEEEFVFRRGLQILNASGIVYAVGAAFARYIYTGIWRRTKDLDVFVKPVDLRAAMDALSENGFTAKVENRNWLAKAKQGEHTIDLIFGSGHGLLPIDDASFEGSQLAEILGVLTRLIPVEEMIAFSAFLAVRTRFDGAEILHLIQRTQGKLDWQRILNRLGNNRQILLWHLILFDFVYPGHSNYLPQDIMIDLFDEMRSEWEKAEQPKMAFRGSALDPFSFRVDIEDWGYEDRRNLKPLVDETGEVM
jgi:hypothetical protein